uniref:Ubiquitin-like protease family profile domain-containing protein n=1 Tax=Arundo donax TaxID=35708 RepID=A0A0A8ZEW0_ARUDO
MKIVTNDHKNVRNQWPDLDMLAWRVNTLTGLPQQNDSTSGALFMLKFVEFWNGDRIVNDFTQEMIDTFRRKLAVMLLKSELNEARHKIYAEESPEI